MSETLLRWLVRVTLCMSALAAQAQGAGPSSVAPTLRPDPLDAKATVPALTYRSSFSRYRAFGDDKALLWREANDAVARIGGWRAYARDAQRPEAASSGTDAATPVKPAGDGASMAQPKPRPPGHAGHQSP